MKKLVIVESPTKAKTIRRFLGPEYLVESCMGHIRDLPTSPKDLPEQFKKKPWARFAVNIDNNFNPIYCVPSSKQPIVKKLKTLVKSAGELILATDEDREGESISWHLTQILKPTMPVKRMVFHEITKDAIKEALKNFRKVDKNLVQAQEARRILDRLVGYSISPFLWKKVRMGLSAGRVQSVAVSLVSNRELERLGFNKTIYWDVVGEYKKNAQTFTGHLIKYNDKRLVRSADFDSVTGKCKNKNLLLMDEKSATTLARKLLKTPFKVTDVNKKQVTRKPAPPFITSTLQQECNRRFGFSSRRTMGVAQKLYELGAITYMRTDSTFLSSQAQTAARSAIVKQYGKNYLPDAPRLYRKKAKGAQEAHEAIRPAGQKFTPPANMRLSGDLLKLYDLIWKRTLASQMKDCIQNQVRVELTAGACVFVSSGVTIQFPGFYRVYKDQDTKELALPPLNKGDSVPCVKLSPVQHETKPPARYTEASLIQKLEKEGVGRPSTYASIISTIQERGYVKKNKNSLSPTFVALIVDRVLAHRFPDYVSVSFTSEMEKDLDDIARGQKDHIKYLKSFYFGNKGLKKLIDSQEKQTSNENFRTLELKGFEGYCFHVGPFGAYVSKKQTSSSQGQKTTRDQKKPSGSQKSTKGKKNGNDVSASLPIELSPADITKKYIDDLIQNKMQGGRLLGKHPMYKKDIFLILGRYGPYLEMRLSDDNSKSAYLTTKKHPLGATKAESKKVASKKVASKNSGSQKNTVQKAFVKRTSLHPFYTTDNITLEGAVRLLELPKVLGKHPETKKEIKKGIGRYGPYVVHDGDFRSVSADSFFDLNFKQALSRIKEPKKRATGMVKELGTHPKSSRPVQLMKGRYGMYIKHKGENYSLPKGLTDPKKCTLKDALNVIDNVVDKTKQDSQKSHKRSKKIMTKGGVKKHTFTKKSMSKIKKRVQSSSYSGRSFKKSGRLKK